MRTPFSTFERYCIEICKSIGFNGKELADVIEKVKYNNTLTDRVSTGLYRLDIEDGFFWMIDCTKIKTFLCSNEPAVIVVDCQLYQKCGDEDAICIDRSHYNCERDGSNESFRVVENTDDDMRRLIGHQLIFLKGDTI